MPADTSVDLPSQAQAVVIGGGAIGASVAYHLAARGWSDTVLLERDQLTCGTTWHAAGIVGPLRATVGLTRLHAYAMELFPRLEEETGQATGYKHTGGLSIARSRERMHELERVAAVGRFAGIDAHVVTPAEIGALHPLLESGDLAGGIWIPRDGQTDPTGTTLAMAKGARLNGARVVEGVTVTGFETRNHSLHAVCSTHGVIRCETAVICAGIWSRELGARAGISVPLQAAEHMYIVTEPIEALGADAPFVRELDSGIYIKADAGKLLIGAFERNARPWAVAGIPEGTSFTQLDEDWDHFEPYLQAALRRVPALETTGIRQFFNGPESFTPDTRHVTGESAEVRGLFVAAGFNSTGIMCSAGVGKTLAEWIVDGRPSLDLFDVDVQRFEPWQASRGFLRARTGESVGAQFDMHWPYRQHETGRDAKRSPFHDRFARRGACFGVVAGWERPLWFAHTADTPEHTYRFGPQAWWRRAADEGRATRDAVALYEQTPFAKFVLEGPDAQPFLQRLCANDVAVLEQRERRLVRRLASFSVHAGEPLLLHDEPLYRDGVAVGVTTSGSFGPRLERPVCIALIEHPAVSEEGFLQEGSYQIEIGSERFDATLHLRPAYDPTGSRLRA